MRIRLLPEAERDLEIGADTPTQSPHWKEFWLLSYVSPYVLLFVIIMFSGAVESSGYSTVLVGESLSIATTLLIARIR